MKLTMSNRCLAHIINLATQALISTHSKSRHYNPEDPDTDLTSGDVGRDTVGLVRAICVKVLQQPYYSVLPSLSNCNQGTFICKKKTALRRYSAA